MNSNAEQSFAQFMETRTDGDTVPVSPLRDLAVDVQPGSSLVSMCCMKQDHGGSCYSTIGSRLRSLSVAPTPFSFHFGAFLEQLAQSAKHIELKCLKLSEVDIPECRELAKFISATVSLQELELNGIEDADSILHSLRSNGTLHAVSIPGESSLSWQVAMAFEMSESAS
jgi:hypothetical protein